MVGTMRLFGRISKFEKQADGTVLIEGIASNECVDSQGEIVKASAMRAALPAYMARKDGTGPLREMHQAIAAGKTLSADVGDDGTTYICAKVVDENACKKVLEGVLQGFSIGGSVPPGGRNKADPKIIETLKLSEISLVDVPANPQALFEICKFDAPLADAAAPVVEVPVVKAVLADTDTLAKLAAAESALTASSDALAKVTAERNELQRRLNEKTLEVKAQGVAKDPKFIERVAKIEALEKGLHDAHLACEQAGDALDKVITERDALGKRLVDVEAAAKVEKLALEKASQDAISKLTGDLNDANTAREESAKKLAEAEVALMVKGVLRAVPISKVDDVEKVVEDESEKPTPGTPARALYELKKVHARGPRA